MKISIKATQLEKQTHSSLIIGVFEDGELTPSAKQLDKASQGYITQLIKQGIFQAKLAQVFPIVALRHTHFEHIVLVGCGKQEALNASQFKKIITSSTRAIASTKIANAINYLSELDVASHDLAWKIKCITETTYESLYRFDLFKTQKEPAIRLKELIIHLPDHKKQKDGEKALKQGLAIAKGVMFTKDLANLPSNICTPSFLAEQAKTLAKMYSSLSVKVLEEKDMQKLGMGALLAVSQGSAEDAKLICLEYKGGKKQKPIALVGKGVTFDTGGNSLKSPDNMVGMKYDMCGAATVLGTLKAAAELKLPINVVGIIAAVENMPGGTAYKPEDILTSLSGQTIEVISTDAEGRLALADALTYCERYQPEVVIDIATLTGAVVIALGFHATGLLSNHETLAKDLINAGTESHD